MAFAADDVNRRILGASLLPPSVRLINLVISLVQPTGRYSCSRCNDRRTSVRTNPTRDISRRESLINLMTVSVTSLSDRCNPTWSIDTRTYRVSSACLKLTFLFTFYFFINASVVVTLLLIKKQKVSINNVLIWNFCWTEIVSSSRNKKLWNRTGSSNSKYSCH